MNMNNKEPFQTQPQRIQTNLNPNANQGRVTQVPPSPKQDLKQRESREEIFTFKLDEQNCQLKLEMLCLKQPAPQDFCQNNINWHYLSEQVQQDGNCLPIYENEQGEQQIFHITNKDKWVIQITCTVNNCCYNGMLTEEEITQKQQFMTIDEYYDELCNDFENFEKKTKEGLITLNLNPKVKKLTTKITAQIGSELMEEYEFLWNLSQQINEDVMTKTIRELNQNFEEKYSFMQQQSQNIQNQLDQQSQILYEVKKQLDELQKTQKTQTELMRKIENKLDILNNPNQVIPPQLPPNQSLKPSDLIKSQGLFFLSPQCISGVTTLEFTIKGISRMGLVIGIDHTKNPIKPQYAVHLNSQKYLIGQTENKFEYTPQVGDQILFKVDMNKGQVVVQANQKEITNFQLMEQGESKLYICVGMFNQMDKILNFIE